MLRAILGRGRFEYLGTFYEGMIFTPILRIIICFYTYICRFGGQFSAGTWFGNISDLTNQIEANGFSAD